ncbi:hypothetical protein [Pseudomonas umsongensis]|uniref:hypothetical protein n=1 Tax=Pseudomonas umsongensis TaxID=198618 RepID=UPI00200AFAEB|nr:hypothetical protein [Pseudomonas umsongensis]MCK8686720.1 hypothetical protein [Pseudomonas umsongensis]
MPVTYSYDANSHACTFSAPSQKNRKGKREIKCHMAPTISWAEFAPYAQAAVENLKSESPDSIMDQVEVLKNIQRYAIAKNIQLPKGAGEWDEYLLGHFEFTLDDLGAREKRSPETRIYKWSNIERYYKRIQEKDMIPIDSYIPSRHLSDGNNMPRQQRSPVGKPAQQVLDTSENWNKSALISRDLCLDEDEFLHRISKSLSSAIQAITEGCLEYIAKMKAAHKLGQRLIERVNPIELKTRIINKDYYLDGIHVTDPNSKDGLSWILAGVNYFLTETDQLNSVSYVKLSSIDFFKGFSSGSTQDKVTKLINQTIGSLGINTANVNENFARLLGHLSARDCAAIASILMIDQPKFPSLGLQSAKLQTSEGAPLIEVLIDEKIIQFSVEKPRAGQFQVEALTPRSAELLKYTLHCTNAIRTKLKHKNDAKANYLFLTVTKSGVICPGNIDNVMHSNGHTLYNEISHHFAGLHFDKETFSLGSLRVTQGLITYFQTGSLYAVSQRLGNQVQTVKSCYIPNWVQERRYIWMIRAFQAKLVLLATINKPWSLETSDFLTEEDLKVFVSKQLKKTWRSDAFSQNFRANFKNRETNSTIFELSDSHLAFEISEESLAALYTFVDHATKHTHPKELEKVDPVLNVSINSLIQLKGLIAGLAEANLTSETEKMIAASLHQGSRLELKIIHQRAQSIAMNQKVANVAIKSFGG